MNDADLLHAVLSGSYDPITAAATRPVIFCMGDAIRCMQPQGWDRARTERAIKALRDESRVRSCPLEGFGGNVLAYGLTTNN